MRWSQAPTMLSPAAAHKPWNHEAKLKFNKCEKNKQRVKLRWPTSGNWNTEAPKPAQRASSSRCAAADTNQPLSCRVPNLPISARLPTPIQVIPKSTGVKAVPSATHAQEISAARNAPKNNEKKSKKRPDPQWPDQKRTRPS